MYERLDLSIADEATGPFGGRRVRVGNSGLVIWRLSTDAKVGHLDFTPEGCTDAVQGMGQQYALTFLGALDAVVEFHSMEPVLPEKIRVATNPKMAEFLIRNLGDSVAIREQSPFQPLLEIDRDTLVCSEPVRSVLYRARNQLEAARYFVDDPGI